MEMSFRCPTVSYTMELTELLLPYSSLVQLLMSELLVACPDVR